MIQLLIERISSMFGIRQDHAMDHRMDELERKSGEVKDHLEEIGRRPDPFADLISTLRRAHNRRENGNGH